ncbi:UNVERIFIED_ORG: hypothetical protein GGE44_000791 [Rhizobium esperanzae]
MAPSGFFENTIIADPASRQDAPPLLATHHPIRKSIPTAFVMKGATGDPPEGSTRAYFFGALLPCGAAWVAAFIWPAKVPAIFGASLSFLGLRASRLLLN